MLPSKQILQAGTQMLRIQNLDVAYTSASATSQLHLVPTTNLLTLQPPPLPSTDSPITKMTAINLPNIQSTDHRVLLDIIGETTDRIRRDIINPNMEMLTRNLEEEVAEILKPHFYGHPITYNLLDGPCAETAEPAPSLETGRSSQVLRPVAAGAIRQELRRPPQA